MRVPEYADRDFTGSALVVKDDKILMMKHSKLGMWLQPGGHIEEDETPDEAAVRECLEETGYEVEIMEEFCPETDFEDNSEDLPVPFNINLHQISEDHYHCDLQFLCRPVEKVEASHSHEHDGLKWLSAGQIKSGKFDMPKNARKTALRALNYIENKR